jgi:hypothetical protein
VEEGVREVVEGALAAVTPVGFFGESEKFRALA